MLFQGLSQSQVYVSRTVTSQDRQLEVRRVIETDIYVGYKLKDILALVL